MSFQISFAHCSLWWWKLSCFCGCATIASFASAHCMLQGIFEDKLLPRLVQERIVMTDKCVSRYQMFHYITLFYCLKDPAGGHTDNVKNKQSWGKKALKEICQFEPLLCSAWKEKKPSGFPHDERQNCQMHVCTYPWCAWLNYQALSITSMIQALLVVMKYKAGTSKSWTWSLANITVKMMQEKWRWQCSWRSCRLSGLHSWMPKAFKLTCDACCHVLVGTCLWLEWSVSRIQ